MKKLKTLLYALVSITVLAMTFTGCSEKEEPASERSEASCSAPSDGSSAASAVQLSNLNGNGDYFSDFDLDTDYNDVAASIKLNGDKADIDGGGAAFREKTVEITKGGTYLITGTLSDGQIHVLAGDDDNVHLVFDGVSVTNSTGSAVYIENAKNTCITLVDGSRNTFTDAAKYTFADAEENEPDAAVFSKDDLSVNGSGTLEVTASYNDGITSKDDLRISGAAISIKSIGDGIKGKDSVVIRDADITIDSQKDGIKSTEADDEEKGFVVIESGSFDITSSNDAFESEGFMIVEDGIFNVKTGNGADTDNSQLKSGQGNAAASDDKQSRSNGNDTRQGADGDFGTMTPSTDENGQMSRPEGGFGGMTPPTDENGQMSRPEGGFGGHGMGMSDGNKNKTADSEKGFKSAKALIIKGGEITADCTDDAVHAGGDIQIDSGTLILKSSDDGIHSDSSIEINGGKIDIQKSYEGIEAAVINVNGGDINVKASDDGFNASEGSSGSDKTDGKAEESSSDPDGNKKRGGMMDISENCKLNINGGTVYVDADGDGLDSNGEMTINGGVTVVDGPTNDGNGALDTGKDIFVNGGTLIAAGSSGMAEIPSGSSKQASIAAALNETQKADTPITVTDKDGNVVVSYAPVKEYTSVVISSPDIVKGSEYSVYTGGEVSGSGKPVTSGTVKNGTLVGKAQLSDTVTTVGEGTLSRMGGGMHGGRQSGSNDKQNKGRSSDIMAQSDGETI